MNYRRLVAAVVSAPLISTTLVATALPASADVPGIAHAAIGVSYPNSTTFHVCPNGSADSVGEWVFELDGIRNDGTLIHVEEGGFASTFSPACDDIFTGGTLEGGFDATLTFARVGSPATTIVGSNATAEVAALAFVEAHWTPQQNANGFST